MADGEIDGGSRTVSHRGTVQSPKWPSSSSSSSSAIWCESAERQKIIKSSNPFYSVINFARKVTNVWASRRHLMRKAQWCARHRLGNKLLSRTRAFRFFLIHFATYMRLQFCICCVCFFLSSFLARGRIDRWIQKFGQDDAPQRWQWLCRDSVLRINLNIYRIRIRWSEIRYTIK